MGPFKNLVDEQASKPLFRRIKDINDVVNSMGMDNNQSLNDMEGESTIPNSMLVMIHVALKDATNLINQHLKPNVTILSHLESINATNELNKQKG